MATIPYAQFLGDKDPYPVLQSTAQRVADICSVLTADQIAAAPAPGKWSIHQIVGHMADTEVVAHTRIRMMMFEESPTLQAYDQDRWVSGWMRENEPFEETLERFRVLRKSTVRALRSATEQELRRVGNHTERGAVTAGDHVILLAGHDINHLGQIDRIVRAIG